MPSNLSHDDALALFRGFYVTFQRLYDEQYQKIDNLLGELQLAEARLDRTSAKLSRTMEDFPDDLNDTYEDLIEKLGIVLGLTEEEVEEVRGHNR